TGLLGDGVHAAKKRGFLVQRVAVVADEYGRNAERVAIRRFHEEYGARRIPIGVTTSLEGRTHAARRETGCIGLRLDELRSREFLDRLAFVIEGQKCVVFFSGVARLWLKPVTEVGGAFGQG